MNEDWRIISSGPLKGKKIEFAPTAGIDRLFEISEEFRKKIFDLGPGGYLISDESSLRDFTGLDEMELSDIQKRIKKVYDIDVSDIKSGNLLEIFIKIHHKKCIASSWTSAPI